MDLTRLVKEGVLHRLRWGIYEVDEDALIREVSRDGSGYGIGVGYGKGHIDGSGGDEYTDEEKEYIMATIKCGSPSVICLLSALEHYHLTDIITKQTWVMVPESKRINDSRLRLIRSRNPHWTKGIKKNEDYNITTLERTLIDCLLHKRLIGSQVALAALKLAVSQKKIRIKDVIDLAKKMKVLHRIMPYLEVLAS